MHKPRTVLLPALLAIAGMISTSASTAHQATAMFDDSRKLTVQGTVKKFTFATPHSLLHLAVVDNKGVESIWELEGGDMSKMARNGWNSQSVKPGDNITVIISPRINGAMQGSFSSMTRTDSQTSH